MEPDPIRARPLSPQSSLTAAGGGRATTPIPPLAGRATMFLDNHSLEYLIGDGEYEARPLDTSKGAEILVAADDPECIVGVRINNLEPVLQAEFRNMQAEIERLRGLTHSTPVQSANDIARTAMAAAKPSADVAVQLQRHRALLTALCDHITLRLSVDEAHGVITRRYGAAIADLWRASVNDPQ
jgi:hypothetical protein